MRDTSAATWDIFCRVVDNFGDAAIAWRIAAQLADEHRLAVRLFVDRLEVLHALRPAIDPHAPVQIVEGVEVRAITADALPPARVALDVLGGGLPESYIARKAALADPGLWIVAEYLSAEPWVASYHRRASPHPATGLERFFFFPGFVPGTGGLWCEAGYAAARATFDAQRFWSSLGFAPPTSNATTVSLFGYRNACVAALVEQWSRSPHPLVVALTDCALGEDVRAALGVPLEARQTLRRGSLEVRCLPFLAQPDYDRLLAACDWNFVRGEDSLVRALWAEQPLIWQPYRQRDAAHVAKLAAFIDWYAPSLPAYAGFAQAWGGAGGADALDWPALAALAPAMHSIAGERAPAARRSGEFVANLVAFCNSHLK